MLGWKEPGLGFLRQKLRCDPEVTHPPELQGFHLEARMTLPYSDHISPKCPFCLLRRESERLHNWGGGGGVPLGPTCCSALTFSPTRAPGGCSTSVHTHEVLPPSPGLVESHSFPSLLDGHGFFSVFWC